MTRRRLLVLTSTFPRRAGDTTPPFVLDLCRELASAFEVHVLAPHAPGALASEVIDGVHVHRYRYFPSRWQRLTYDGGITARLRRHPWLLCQVPFLLGAGLLAAIRLVRVLAPDVIHAHWVLPQGLVALVARRCSARRIPVLCTLHGTDVNGWNVPPLPWLKAVLLRHMTRVTAVSDSLRQSALLLGAPPGGIDVIPMGVDVDGTFHMGPAPGRVAGEVVTVGRLVPGKGTDILLRAVASLAARGVPLTVVVVGDGTARASLERLAAGLGIGGQVRFLGAQPPAAVAARFRGATVAVFPFTAPEGLGMVVAEAQACGCPVIVSDIPSLRDLAVPGVTAVVVPAGNPEALADALGTLCADPVRRAALAQAARARVSRDLSWKSVSARYLSIIERM